MIWISLNKNKIPTKNTWYDWIINHIPANIRKAACGFNDKLVSFFETNTLKDFGRKNTYGREKKANKTKTQHQSQDKIIENRNLFQVQRENK